MGNFEKLSVLVIVVIIVMILVVAIYTWQENPAGPETAKTDNTNQPLSAPSESPWGDDPRADDPRTDDPQADPQGGEPLDPPAPVSDPGGDVPPLDIPVPGPESGPGATPRGTANGDEPEVNDEPWIYEVKSGDVLGVIASRELGTTRRMKDIVALNPGMNPDSLTIGQKLKMPPRTAHVGPGPLRSGPTVGTSPVRGGDRPVAGSTYTTRRGDRLDNIAKLAYGNVERWPEIFALNKDKVTDPMRLDEGVSLRLPR